MSTRTAGAPACAAPRPAAANRVAAVALLLAHVALWTWAGAVSRTNLDLSGDMVEAYAWGQGFEWGYFKHPPLMAWVTGAWFSLMPVTQEAYALLAALNTAIGLAGFAVLCREFLPRRWCLVALAAAMLTPGTTTMAMRFNANAVLVATWPWASAYFVRWMRRGRLADALACALACALAMLGKYFSAVLIVALLLTAFIHRPWRARLTDRCAWAAGAAFALLLTPHLAWLAAHDYAPLQYARDATHVAGDSPAGRALHFACAHLALPALGFGLIAVAVRGPGRRAAVLAALRDLLRPSTRPEWLLALLPVLLTAAMTLAVGARTSVVWGLPMSMGLILCLAVRLAARGIAPQVRPAAVYLAACWLAVASLAPLVWWVDAQRAAPAAADPREELAQAVAARWSERYRTPLRWVGGTPGYAAAVSFYARSHPRLWDIGDSRQRTPWVSAAALRAQGGAIVCALGDAACRARGAHLAGREWALTVAKVARGRAFPSRAFALYWIAPAAGPAKAGWW